MSGRDGEARRTVAVVAMSPQLFGTRQVERIDTHGRVEAELYVAAADCFCKSLVFVFWVDDKHFGAKHHTTERFELHCKAFTGTRLGEHYCIAVF